MMRASYLLLGRAARALVSSTVLLLGFAPHSAALAQEGAAIEQPAAEQPPAGEQPAAPAEGSAPAGEASAEPLPTIPVDTASPPPLEGGPRYPYSFAATRLRHTEFDDSAQDGIGIEGSYLLLPNVYAVGAIFKAEADDARSTESTLYELGGGYRQEIMSGMDLNATLRISQDDINSEPQSQVKMGFKADLGVRAQLTPQLEGGLAVAYVERSRLARPYLEGFALYEVMPRLSFGAEAIVGSSSIAYGLLGRWAF